ncbi:MAG: DNA cytosine methyltransferase [Candidatus Pristimantibacillus lignocellulolyticus]|uniref:Cytosine-specific methyltransferase n=1 Tax=Candidatus Pristimantibacillus lignocellulolyticus TaxID=2994561 RepID=A0A9J6Z913_9BACL|nr:MAG: DNA cytosine methyltransferase [Candidatus Pristimantibacillus lignocellulolyticus]
MKKQKPTVIDMFCGCGGLSRGFMDAGFEVLLGVDNNDDALISFKANHDNAVAMDGDLFQSSTILQMASLTEGKQIDLIIGGPPCQGFSLTGKRAEDDKRNTLFQAMVNAVAFFQPKAFVLENVPGLATLYNGKAREAIIKEFSDLGYTVNDQILYAPDYGVPQIRKRLFFVGLLSEEKFEFPKPILSPDKYITCGDAISDLHDFTINLGTEVSDYHFPPKSQYQKKMRKNSTQLFNHVGTKHSDLVIDVISQVPEGGNHKDLPSGVGDSRKFNEAWTRYHRNKPSKTIDTGHRNHFHYEFNRVPTVRENARLQSFSDDFRFSGNKTQQYRQVGNAVPPLLGYHLGTKLKDYL